MAIQTQTKIRIAKRCKSRTKRFLGYNFYNTSFWKMFFQEIGLHFRRCSSSRWFRFFRHCFNNVYKCIVHELINVYGLEEGVNPVCSHSLCIIVSHNSDIIKLTSPLTDWPTDLLTNVYVLPDVGPPWTKLDQKLLISLNIQNNYCHNLTFLFLFEGGALCLYVLR